MVMERIHGVPISDLARLRAAGTDIAQLAENGVRIFFTQVFRHNFFHADMHPGNIFVLIDDPRRPRYAAVDFGIVGTLDPRDQHYLAENFLAVFDRDYRRVAQLHVESGWVPADTRIDEMESAVRTVCEPIFDRPLKDISFGRILLRLFEISRRFNMQIQPQLLLLQKTLLNVEGLGRELYPELDIWQHRQPHPARVDARAHQPAAAWCASCAPTRRSCWTRRAICRRCSPRWRGGRRLACRQPPPAPGAAELLRAGAAARRRGGATR